jgi:hypothetical protein
MFLVLEDLSGLTQPYSLGFFCLKVLISHKKTRQASRVEEPMMSGVKEFGPSRMY